MTYEIKYDHKGKPQIRDGIKTIPADVSNVDFREFLEWNGQQETPLDFQTIIPPVVTPETEMVFDLPIRTPAIYADDIFVSSRKIKDDADEALDEAVSESEKAHGTPKSLDLIARSTVKNVSVLRQRISDLEKTIDKLDKRLKKLGG